MAKILNFCEMVESEYAPPLLCCCEYVDRNGERNHILACCCDCQDFDLCFDKLITCRSIRRKDIQGIMGTCFDRIRCPGRGGAFSPLAMSNSMIAPFLLQPLIALLLILYSRHVAFFISFIVLLLASTVVYMSKNNARSQIIYYWTVSSMVYSIFMYEMSVQPLLEIRWDENLIVVILSILAITFLCLTKLYSGRSVTNDGSASGTTSNGIALENVCTICRTKVCPRTIHCTICQTCIVRYDHHCYWLNCCIGERNQGYFVVGSFLGLSALIYGSLLILTSVCRPEFVYGVLLPTDCSDVTNGIELGLCYCCGVYCLGISGLLALELLYHIWLISRGLSGEEWRVQKYQICGASPYNRGCLRNWWCLIAGLRKFRT